MSLKVIYHRGRHGVLPDGRMIQENSLAAFEEALAEHAEIVELDVWNDLRIAHDPVGSQAVPTLPEVLALLAGRCVVNIEIKSPAVALDVVACVRDVLKQPCWGPDKFIISAFHHATALQCKAIAPFLRVGVINDGVLLLPYVEQLRSNGIDNLHLEWANIYMDIEAGYELRDAIRASGMQLWVWTVNSIEVLNTVAAYGVDAVFTDRPDLLRGLL